VFVVKIMKNGGAEVPTSVFTYEWADDHGYDYNYPHGYAVPFGTGTKTMNVLVTDTRDGSVGTAGIQFEVVDGETFFNCEA